MNHTSPAPHRIGYALIVTMLALVVIGALVTAGAYAAMAGGPTGSGATVEMEASVGATVRAPFAAEVPAAACEETELVPGPSGSHPGESRSGTEGP